MNFTDAIAVFSKFSEGGRWPGQFFREICAFLWESGLLFFFQEKIRHFHEHFVSIWEQRSTCQGTRLRESQGGGWRRMPTLCRLVVRSWRNATRIKPWPSRNFPGAVLRDGRWETEFNFFGSFVMGEEITRDFGKLWDLWKIWKVRLHLTSRLNLTLISYGVVACRLCLPKRRLPSKTKLRSTSSVSTTKWGPTFLRMLAGSEVERGSAARTPMPLSGPYPPSSGFVTMSVPRSEAWIPSTLLVMLPKNLDVCGRKLTPKPGSGTTLWLRGTSSDTRG